MFTFLLSKRGASNILIVLIAPVLLNACATMNNPDQLSAAPTLAQIKEMVAQGKGDESILRYLQASRAVYYLSGRDVLDLHEARVSLTVLDYMLSTPQLYPSRSAPSYRRSEDRNKTSNHGDAHFQGKVQPKGS